MTAVDAQQLGFLIDRHGAAMTLYARQWCRAPEDAVQEALIDLMRCATAPRQPLAWLYTTVRRRALNQARAERRRRKHQQQAGRQRAACFVPPTDAQDALGDVEGLLQRLPALEREIVVARVWGQLSFDEIAQLVGRSTSSVHRRYQRALARLGDMIDVPSSESRHRNESRPAESGRSSAACR